MTPRQEKKLIRQLKRRDERAFRELVRVYQHKVYNLVYRILGDEQEAEDVAQDVFLAVFRAIDQFRGDAKFSTWLYRIATNHARNCIKYLARRQTRRHETLDENHEGPSQHPLTSHTPSPDRVVMGRELEAIIQAAIGQLEEEHRTLIVLRELENLPYTDISTITGLPVGTVKSRLHRARLQLKKTIDRYLQGEPQTQKNIDRTSLTPRPQPVFAGGESLG